MANSKELTDPASLLALCALPLYNKVRVTLASMGTSFSNLSILMDDFATRTIPTTGMTRSSAKRVRTSCSDFFPAHPSIHLSVWVGPLVVKELKRIVEQSEIIKYAFLIFYDRHETTPFPVFYLIKGKTTQTGQRKILSGSRSWRSASETITSHSRLEPNGFFILFLSSLFWHIAWCLL